MQLNGEGTGSHARGVRLQMVSTMSIVLQLTVLFCILCPQVPVRQRLPANLFLFLSYKTFLCSTIKEGSGVELIEEEGEDGIIGDTASPSPPTKDEEVEVNGDTTDGITSSHPSPSTDEKADDGAVADTDPSVATPPRGLLGDFFHGVYKMAVRAFDATLGYPMESSTPCATSEMDDAASTTAING